MNKAKVTIIGTGALGRTFAKTLYANGIKVHSLFNRSSGSLETLAEEVDPQITGTFPPNYNDLGDIIFIATSDQVITKIADDLALLSDDFTGKTVAHCSGTRTSDDLLILQKKGAAVASFHPIQTFTATSNPGDFRDIFIDMEGDETAKKNLNEIAKLFGAQAIAISKKAKPYLHASGVMISNYLLALLEASANIAELGGIQKSQARKMLFPLAHQSIENAKAVEKFSDALSGPISRGDDNTVAEHINLLNQNNNLLNLYKRLGIETVKLAVQKGSVSDEERSKLIKLLNDPPEVGQVKDDE